MTITRNHKRFKEACDRLDIAEDRLIEEQKTASYLRVPGEVSMCEHCPHRSHNGPCEGGYRSRCGPPPCTAEWKDHSELESIGKAELNVAKCQAQVDETRKIYLLEANEKRAKEAAKKAAEEEALSSRTAAAGGPTARQLNTGYCEHCEHQSHHGGYAGCNVGDRGTPGGYDSPWGASETRCECRADWKDHSARTAKQKEATAKRESKPAAEHPAKYVFAAFGGVMAVGVALFWIIFLSITIGFIVSLFGG